jgi:UPF0755 protein
VYRYDRYGRNISDRGRVPRRVLLASLIVIAVLLASIMAVRSAYYQRLQPVSSSQQVVIVTIEKGTTSTEISQTLQSKGLIRSGTIFQWYIRTNNVRDKLQAGTYALRPSMSVQEVVDVMVKGSVKAELFTILPGQRLDQVRQAFINAGFQPAAVDQALDPAQYAGHPALADKPVSANLEGFLYPDSYQKNDSTDPSVIVKEALDEMAEHLTPDVRSAFAKHGLSIYQGVTLASMLEQEVSKQSDRAQAAQVFLKRLQSDMPLGSDVTAFYGAIIKGAEPTTDFDSPYNTLKYKGLPPGPISNVSASSLLAVANPADTDWLYFVAGDDGVTYFAKTNDEHIANIKQHCHQKCAPIQ